MDFILSALSDSMLEVTLTVFALVFIFFFYIPTQRRIRRLEAKLDQTQSMLTREIKMVNQGAIGVGRRFAQVEKKLTKASDNTVMFKAKELADNQPAQQQASKFSQIQDQIAKPKPVKRKPISAVKEGLTTKAEQSLTSWLKEHQTA